MTAPSTETPTASNAASPWVRRWSHLVAPTARVLDVACGSGRHLRWFAMSGCRVTGVDRDATVLAGLDGLGELVVADLESGPWPFPGRQFDAVVVTRYLWRPLLRTLVASVAPGGVLICETFALGQQTVGRPTNPEFLLRPGELLTSVDGLRVVAFEDGFDPAAGCFTQRIVAVRQTPGGARPPRHLLAGGAPPPGG